MRANQVRNVKSGHNPKTGECLFRHPNFVAKPEGSSFESGMPDWEASTLPLSYTRQNHIYSSPQIPLCKGVELTSNVKRATLPHKLN